MFINLRELELRPVRFNLDVPADKIEFDGKVTQASPLHAEGSAQLISRSLGEIRVEGQLSVKVNAPCDRCLESAVVGLDRSFDLVYIPTEEIAKGGEEEIDEAALEVGYYRGAGLELDDVLREVVLLALPMQFVCSEDCKGICSSCGQNRNQGECDCKTLEADGRWSQLRYLKTEIGSRN